MDRHRLGVTLFLIAALASFLLPLGSSHDQRRVSSVPGEWLATTREPARPQRVARREAADKQHAPTPGRDRRRARIGPTTRRTNAWLADWGSSRVGRRGPVSRR